VKVLSQHVLIIAYLDEIHLVERLVGARLLDIENADNVLVIEVSQKLHLAQRSQAKHGMIERGDLLDSNLLSGRLVYGRAVGGTFFSNNPKTEGTIFLSTGLTRPRHTHPHQLHPGCRTARSR
jgi:hypothetical protein